MMRMRDFWLFAAVLIALTILDAMAFVAFGWGKDHGTNIVIAAMVVIVSAVRENRKADQ